jgi:cytoskeleton protein RodZ
VTDPIEATESARPYPATAGAKLRAAREASGWSIHDVAAQLKLAPRQVAALEEDDWSQLPGRTFVRGFARNYARFLGLDPDSVLALLPPPEHAPGLERPSFAAARRPMGEIPVERASKPSAARWLVPLVLLAIVAAAGVYQYTQLTGASRGDEIVPAAGAPAEATAPAPAGSGSTATALPNPLADTTAPAAPAPEGGVAPAAGAPEKPAAAPAPQPAPTPTPAPAAATDATLVLAFKGTSWAEVRDANGRVILQMTGGAGMTQTVNGTPPFELALGNAPDVAVTFRGQALDLAPYTRGNVARVSLR